jgi:hypothetical protein
MSKSLLVNQTRQYNSLTNNGAVTHSTSLSTCLNMFFLAGASRRMSEEDIIHLFLNARVADRNLAYQILFWARDCRGGAGEKRFFKVIAKYCDKHLNDEWDSLAIHVPDFGSWKDLFVIESPNQNKLNFLSVQLKEHENANLLAKWFPRNGPWFVAMHKYLGKSPKAFRKYLVAKSNTVEQLVCSNRFEHIEYSKVPSMAMNKYRNLFGKKDGARFSSWVNDVLAGNAKANASVIFPHELYQAIKQGDDEKAVEAQWSSLPNYMEGSEERILPVCDVSGSMMGLPMDVCVSLGLYISERNEGIFRDAFITFSEHPEMCYVQGDTLAERMRNLSKASWGYNTNLEATFSLLLNTAKRESLSQLEMPTKILIISDMEFDEGTVSGSTNLDMIKREYAAAGYEIPQLIFWNVAGRIGNIPSSAHESNVGLVSGFSPAILTSILQGEVKTPYELMLTAVDTDKYRAVTSSLDHL